MDIAEFTTENRQQRAFPECGSQALDRRFPGLGMVLAVAPDAYVNRLNNIS